METIEKYPRIRYAKTPGKSFTAPSRTKQSYKDEASIHTILKRYNRTGFLVDPSIKPSSTPMYGDFTNGTDFQSIQDRIAQAHGDFERLPSHLREFYKNSPSALLDAMADPDQAETLREQGILPPLEKVEIQQDLLDTSKEEIVFPPPEKTPETPPENAD